MSDASEVRAVFKGAVFLKTDGYRYVKFPRNEQAVSFLAGLYEDFPGLISHQTQDDNFVEVGFNITALMAAEAIFCVESDPRLETLCEFIHEYADLLPHSVSPNLNWSRPVPSAA